jgi:type IV pilus assembly protein PilM
MSLKVPAWLRATGPSVALEIAPRRVTAVAVTRKAAQLVLTGHATEFLPDGAVAPSLTAANILDATPVTEAVRRALTRAAGRTRRLGLVVPDSLAKVSLVRFEKVPDKPEDLAQLVRWQVRKTAPFRIEDAQVSWVPGMALEAGGREFVVTLARRDIIQEYERVVAAAGAQVGIVDLASLNLVNLVMATTEVAGDWLLLHLTADYTTIAVVRNGDLIFFRTLRAEGEGSLTDFLHQAAMYYEDRLGGGGFARAVLAGTADVGANVDDAETIRRALLERLGAKVEAVDPRTAVTLRERIAAPPELLDALASPIGLLVRDQAA